MLFNTGHADDETVRTSGVQIPPGYRDWGLISVAHEEGGLNDLRAILGNDIAIKAYRDGTLPFPDGTIIARLAWDYVSSEENDKVFGHPQSFVAGASKEGVQFMVKDSAKYVSTGGRGYLQFNDGKSVNPATLRACFPCHAPAKKHDFIYTHYAPQPPGTVELSSAPHPLQLVRIRSISANVFSIE
jgi:Cytochrome P460